MAYEQLVRDPVGAVRSMYATFGEELSDGRGAGMRAYSDERPQGVYGRHRTSSPTSGSPAATSSPRSSRTWSASDVTCPERKRDRA